MDRKSHLLEQIWARMSFRRVARDYGEVWTFRRYPFFATEPIPFVGILFRDGTPAILFDRGPRRDFCPYATRLAADRLFAAQGCKFPNDLSDPALAEALWDMLWLARSRPRPRLLEPLSSAFRHAELATQGRLVVEVHWDFDGQPDRCVLDWDEHRLDFVPSRFYPEDAARVLAKSDVQWATTTHPS